MKKRLLALLLVLVMVLGLLPMSVLAAENEDSAPDSTGVERTEDVQALTEPDTDTDDDSPVTDTDDDSPDTDDEGTYLISCASELAWLAQEVNGGTGTDYNGMLTADVDLSGEDWTPIGQTYATRYAGIFDGNGYQVTGLEITGSAAGNYGLFGYVEGGTIRNLTVAGEITVTGGSSSYGSYGVGGLVGQLSGAVGGIENCINQVAVTGVRNVGGLVGYVSSGYGTATKTIKASANLGAVKASSTDAGGLVGNISGQVAVSDCYNRGPVSADSWRAGGLTGYLNSSYATLSSCYTTGEVTDAGSLDHRPAIGNSSSGTADDCYYLSTLGTDTSATAKTEKEMLSSGFAALLGAAFQRDMDEPVNDGYPILSWQDTTPKYEVRVTAQPTEAVVTLTDDEGAEMSHVTASGGVYTYRLPDGTYHYSAAAFGYESAADTLTVDGEAAEGAITLEEAAKQTVTFDVTPAEAAALAAVTLAHDGSVLAAQADGTYLLPSGEYTYTVKAKGYAKVAGALAVDAEQSEAQTVTVSLEVSTAWDGEELEEPTGSGTEDAPFLIENGAQLAWLADRVNSSTSNLTSSHAKLIGDIDLGEAPWTPIGNAYSNVYKSTLDGDGHQVSGLKVSGQSYAGLVGHAASATIKNLVVKGTVDGTQYTGGLLGQADTGVKIENCASHVKVTGTGYWTGGIVGRLNGGDDTISGCYNTGTVSGKTTSGGYAGGIVGLDDIMAAAVTDCYNTGAIDGYTAGGIVGKFGSGASISNCYSTGAITGTTVSSIATGSYSSALLSNCYYLDGQAADSRATAQTATELKNLVSVLGGEQWKTVPSLNDGYPVLSWQKSDEPALIPLAETEGADWGQDDAGAMLPTATWTAVDHADSYTVLLWEVTDRVEGNVTSLEFIKVAEAAEVTAAEYDFSAAMQEHGYGDYYFTVTPIAAEGGGYASGAVPATSEEAAATGDCSFYHFAAKLDAPTNLAWDGPVATWTQSHSAAAYMVAVYRLNDAGDSYSYVAGGMVGTTVTTLDCSRYFAAGGTYVFTVTAMALESIYLGDETYDTESETSAVYKASSSPEVPGEEHDDTWVEITSAQQWVALANVENIPIDHDPTVTEQTVAWGKKYYLGNDLDFSTLSAAERTKTVSIGNINNRFTGIMDGNGYQITGLTLSNNDAGLFNYIASTGLVCNLSIVGANVLFSDNAAVLACNQYGTIRDCAVINTNITADTGAVLGGMVSRNYGVVEDSYVLGGKLTSNSATATGHGGFVGSNETGGLIQRCYTTMEVVTSSAYAGGFVGLGYGGTIRDCFALGDVTAYEYSGGFVGRSVYSGNVYENCYAAGGVTVTSGAEGHGFIAPSKPDSAFHPDVSAEIKNCYYLLGGLEDSFATGKHLEEMKQGSFLVQLSGISSTGAWTQAEEQNNGLPYLSALPAPESIATEEMTVEIALGTYDKEHYGFRQLGDVITVTLDSTGNTRVMDVLDAAQNQGLLSYAYATSSDFGRYIHTINGYPVDAPDGWMFTINDTLSNVSASLAIVQDQDKILWYEGTTENLFRAPTWEELMLGAVTEWIDLATREDLLKLVDGTYDLSRNYRLTADIDLDGVAFVGIGSRETPFTGMFDGQNYVISNLSVSGGTDVGFFRAIKGATVKNVTIEQAVVSGTKNVGVLVGYAMAELDTGDLTNNQANLIGTCTVSGTVSGQGSVGGLVGFNGGKYDSKTQFSIYSAIDKCHADVAVTGTGASTTEGNKIGGLVGDNQGYLTKSSAAGPVSAVSSAIVGGLCGSGDGGVYDSYATGSVSGKSHVGGLLGSGSGAVEGCYSLGAVFGTDSQVGGFAGSFSGTVENSMSAGVVTPGSSYCGGFIGSLTGTLAGVENQITVKNSYGNCYQQGIEALKPIGNASQFMGQSNEDAMAAIRLETMSETADRLWEMFGINLPLAALEAEADKYRDSITVANSTAVNTALTLLRDGQSPGEDVAVAVTVVDETGSLTAVEGGLKLGASYAGVGTATAQVTLRLSSDAGSFYKLVTVYLLPQTPVVEDLMDTIAATYTDRSGEWTVLDMAAYLALKPDAVSKTSADAVQSYINYAVGTVADYTTGGYSSQASVYAKAEIILRSVGGDTTRLYPVNSSTALDNAAKLRNLTVNSYYDAPWVLLADLQGNTKLTTNQIDGLIDCIGDGQGEDGLFSYSYGGVTYSDPDTAGTVLAALASYYGEDEQATAIVDRAVTALSEAQGVDGSFGSANSDAVVIIGLVALGLDPAQDDRFVKNDISLLNALLNYTNDTQTGFTYAGQDNALATEQGFRALIAVAQAGKQGKAFNIYDFSALAVEALRATGTGEVVKPEPPTGTGTITVRFTLKTDSTTWIPRKTLTLQEGSTVYHALIEALGDNYIQVGAEQGYVRSITKRSTGLTLGEFDKGENSGWVYKVGDEAPEIGLTSYLLEDGDEILWFYTTDWETEPGFEGGSGQKPVVEPEPEQTLPFTDVSDHWALEAIQYVYENKLMNGTDATSFTPDAVLSRAMLATILYRMEGEPELTAKSPFTDVPSDAWYTDGVIWASQNGIVKGVGQDAFAPADSVTREQVAVMLYRYAQYKNDDTTATRDLDEFEDVHEVSDWASEAMQWAYAQGVLTGRTATTMAPAGTTSRAEAATILMRFQEGAADS